MFIDRLTLKNYRGFINESFVFPDYFTVVIGKNGMGKSSVLHGLEVAAGAYLLGLEGVQYKRHISESEIRKSYNPDTRSWFSEVPCVVEAEGTFEAEAPKIVWRRVVPKSGARTTSSKADVGNIQRIAEKNSRDLRQSKNPLFPILNYFSTERLSRDIRKKSRVLQRDIIRDGYYGALSDGSDFDSVKGWMANYHVRLADDLEFEGTYDAVMKAAGKAIPYLKEIRFNREWHQPEALCELPDQTPRRLPHELMSDGLFVMMKIVLEIAYRCAILNGHLGEGCVEKSRGVVLIDEIDMHLHPTWQKHVAHDLRQAFPNIQFVVTTHSPFIVQSLKANQIINLEHKPLAQDPDRRSLSEAALYMGVETEMSEPFEAKVQDATLFYEKLNAAKTMSTAEKEKLGQELHSILEKHSDDPAFVAQLSIKKLSQLGK